MQTALPKINASVAAVLNPSANDVHANISLFLRYLYGFFLYPKNVTLSSICNSLTIFFRFFNSGPFPNIYV